MIKEPGAAFSAYPSEITNEVIREKMHGEAGAEAIFPGFVRKRPSIRELNAELCH